MSYLFVFLGVVLLYYGGELLVRNASHLATNFKVSPMVIGLTVVAFGTSSPELAATLVSTISGVSDVAIGTVLGSNIANLGLILGLTGLIYPLVSERQFIKREVPIMIAVSLLLFPALANARVERYEGAILLVLLGLYLLYQFRQDQEAVLHEVEELEAGHKTPTWQAALGVFLGMILLVSGAQSLVSGAVKIATNLGVSERVIGLTLVAFGTSLPEMAASIVAAIKHETDIILGNIVGSNIFNVLAVLGATALVTPLHVSYHSVRIDLWVMMGLSVFVFLMMLSRNRVGRSVGLVLLLLYGGYIAYLFRMTGVA